jgi:predicted RNA-binding protein YlxR (DUF448 family)
MIRLALAEQGRVEMNDRSGRGGYLHRTEDCWRRFLNRKSHFRAFRTEISKAAKETLIRQLKARDWE